MKVLVVMDDLVVRRHVEVALTKGGFQPIGVTDGLAAWEILRRADSPRLLVLDWTMMGLDGPEILARLAAIPGRRPAHVLMTSVRQRPEDVAAALDAGADDFLGKPFHAVELRARVQAGARRLEQLFELERRIVEGDRPAA
ncbi:MAG: response regulator [Candidatus Eisenbacteria bacterium]